MAFHDFVATLLARVFLGSLTSIKFFACRYMESVTFQVQCFAVLTTLTALITLDHGLGFPLNVR